MKLKSINITLINVLAVGFYDLMIFFSFVKSVFTFRLGSAPKESLEFLNDRPFSTLWNSFLKRKISFLPFTLLTFKGKEYNRNKKVSNMPFKVDCIKFTRSYF